MFGSHDIFCEIIKPRSMLLYCMMLPRHATLGTQNKIILEWHDRATHETKPKSSTYIQISHPNGRFNPNPFVNVLISWLPVTF